MTDDDLRALIAEEETGLCVDRYSAWGAKRPMTAAEREDTRARLVEELGRRETFDCGGIRYSVLDGKIKRGLPT